MFPVTFQGSPAYLLDDSPDWMGSVTLGVDLPLNVEQGLNAIETRRQLGDTPRLTLSYSTTINMGSLPSFRNALQALNDLPVLCPLWMAWFDAGAAPAVTTAFYVLMDDTASPSIQAASGLPFSRPAYPLLVGRLMSIPDPNLQSDVEAVADISFVENDASSLTLPTYSWPNALNAANGGRPMLPIRPDWATNPTSGAASVDIDRQAIGQLRSTADVLYPQPARRDVSQAFTLTAGDAWQFLSFWLTMGAGAENFWIPLGISEATLTADVGAGDTVLHIDAPANIANNSFVVLDDLNNRAAVKVTGTVGSTWTLAGAPGTAFVAANTRIESLMLGRFATTKLSLTFEDLDQATVRAQFKEVPLEVVGASAETITSTFGPLPTNAWLYVFTINYPGGAEVWRYTSFERDLTNGGHTYSSVNLEHDTITESATIERQTVNLKARNFAGHPLSLLVPFQLEWPLMVQIYEVDIPTEGATAATNPRCYFYGEVTKCDTDGPFLNAQAASLSSLFDRQIPRRIYNPGCNWILGETKCGINLALWKWQGNVTSWSGTTSALVLASVASASSPTNTTPLNAHLFAGGYLSVGSGTGVQYRMIMDSTAAAGGVLTLTLATGFITAPAPGSVVTFYPGCDGQAATCKGTFNNYGNFGGFPWVPAANPTTAQLFANNYGVKK